MSEQYLPCAVCYEMVQADHLADSTCAGCLKTERDSLRADKEWLLEQCANMRDIIDRNLGEIGLPTARAERKEKE